MLTFANWVDYLEGDIQKKSKSHLEKRKVEWINATHTLLVQEKIPRDLMRSIPILPAGYYKKPELYDESWRDVLISGIVSRVQKIIKNALNLEADPDNFCPIKE